MKILNVVPWCLRWLLIAELIALRFVLRKIFTTAAILLNWIDRESALKTLDLHQIPIDENLNA